MGAVFIIGIILLIVGIVCFFFYRSSLDKLRNILATETAKIKDIIEEHKVISSDKVIGTGSFEKKVEVKGDIECDSPLISEIGKKECVYYRSEVRRKWEEIEHYTDSEGKRDTRTVTGEDTVSSQTESREFFVNDGTGKIKVSPDGAEIDLIQVIDRFEPASGARMSGSYLQFGDFRLNIGGFNFGEARKTLGYHISEKIFPFGRRVYILGSANDSTGELRISRTINKGDKFIITTKSEEELISQTKQSANILRIAAIIGIILGIILFIIGLFVK